MKINRSENFFSFRPIGYKRLNHSTVFYRLRYAFEWKEKKKRERFIKFSKYKMKSEKCFLIIFLGAHNKLKSHKINLPLLIIKKKDWQPKNIKVFHNKKSERFFTVLLNSFYHSIFEIFMNIQKVVSKLVFSFDWNFIFLNRKKRHINQAYFFVLIIWLPFWVYTDWYLSNI